MSKHIQAYIHTHKGIFLAFCFEIISDTKKLLKKHKKSHTPHLTSQTLTLWHICFIFSLSLYIYIFSEQFEIGLQIWHPLPLSMSVHKNKDTFPYKYSISIKTKKLTLIWYYYLINRLHSNFTNFPTNVFCSKIKKNFWLQIQSKTIPCI